MELRSTYEAMTEKTNMIEGERQSGYVRLRNGRKAWSVLEVKEEQT